MVSLFCSALPCYVRLEKNRDTRSHQDGFANWVLRMYLQLL